MVPQLLGNHHNAWWLDREWLPRGGALPVEVRRPVSGVFRMVKLKARPDWTAQPQVGPADRRCPDIAALREPGRSGGGLAASRAAIASTTFQMRVIVAAYQFAEQLDRYGPGCGGLGAIRLPAARAYCRWLARTHYENFTVVSWLTPRPLRQHMCNIYAYCRWADDLADETAGGRRSLELLDWWHQQLQWCYDGRVEHPVFVALEETIEQFAIPPEPFIDLLDAFRQDQRVRRYATAEQLLAYCSKSANPVGRLVLRLGRCYNDQRVRLSDSICTGLQLINFCQDVQRDWQRGRIYLPQESWQRFGVEEPMFQRGQCNGPLRDLMRHEVQRAEGYLMAGQPLVGQLPRELRRAVWLFAAGGLAIATAIRRAGYDVWRSRPTLSRWARWRLLIRCCVGAGGSP